MLYQLSYSRLFGCGGWNWTTYLSDLRSERDIGSKSLYFLMFGCGGWNWTTYLSDLRSERDIGSKSLYFLMFGCGGWNWTTYLRVMSPTRYRFSTPHWWIVMEDCLPISPIYRSERIPFLYSALYIRSGEPGFEPGQTESKSGVLPLDDSPTRWE